MDRDNIRSSEHSQNSGTEVNTAPIALFAYNRVDHLRRTVEALAANELADQSDLHIYSDGPRNSAAVAAVQEVRNWLPGIRGFKSISAVHRPNNLGLANSIINGVTELVDRYGQIIVLEDDMVTSPYFLRYMNEALERYERVEEVISIHGYIYPVRCTLPETFLLRGADCWGWATWQRGWRLFDADGRKLLRELESQGLCRDFDFDGSASYTTMLKMQIAGQNDSWAVRWYASAFLAGKLTLYPGKSLVSNIGNDGSGRHCGGTDVYRTQLAEAPIEIRLLPAVEDHAARNVIAQYFRRGTGWGRRASGLLGRVRRFLK